ncbi:hypothetical protein [Streptomyces sp. C]|uniref:hypothetical protein n=1 Tax=Streptomyces sp. C TaxID=253839 RepID=UPI0001DEF030|nr:hypothetical protein [Streptomyces sp. C]EFL15335.1 predicted protein [Streptomyces sp. C]
MRRNLHFGTARARTWVRWLPLHVGPVHYNRDHPWRSAIGFAVGSFGHYVYVFVA